MSASSTFNPRMTRRNAPNFFGEPFAPRSTALARSLNPSSVNAPGIKLDRIEAIGAGARCSGDTLGSADAVDRAAASSPSSTSLPEADVVANERALELARAAPIHRTHSCTRIDDADDDEDEEEEAHARTHIIPARGAHDTPRVAAAAAVPRDAIDAIDAAIDDAIVLVVVVVVVVVNAAANATEVRRNAWRRIARDPNRLARVPTPVAVCRTRARGRGPRAPPRGTPRSSIVVRVKALKVFHSATHVRWYTRSHAPAPHAHLSVQHAGFPGSRHYVKLVQYFLEA